MRCIGLTLYDASAYSKNPKTQMSKSMASGMCKRVPDTAMPAEAIVNTAMKSTLPLWPKLIA